MWIEMSVWAVVNHCTVEGSTRRSEWEGEKVQRN